MKRSKLQRGTKQLKKSPLKKKSSRVSSAFKVKILTTKKADTLHSIHIRNRDKKCFFHRVGCQNPASQNSHFWGRAISATRYNDDNCDGICGGCHMKHESNKQGLYRTLKIEQLGQERYDALEQLARTRVKRRDAIIDLMKKLYQD